MLHHRSSCSLVWTIDDHIMRCGIIHLLPVTCHLLDFNELRMASYLTFTVTFTLVLAAYDGTTSSMFTMLVMCHGP